MSEKIIMDKKAMMEVGANWLLGYLKKQNVNIFGAKILPNVYPNIVYEKDGERYAILIDADEVHTQPELTIHKMFNMYKAKMIEGYNIQYASFGIASVDPEKFDRHILIDNDPQGYYINFTGLKDITLKVPDKNTEEYKEFVLNSFGLSFMFKDTSFIENFLDDNVQYDSFFNKDIIFNNKKDVLHFLNGNFKNDNNNWKYFLIRYVGEYSEFKSDVELPDGTKDFNAIVRIPQPDGEPGLIIDVDYHQTKLGMAIIIEFNDKKLISSIFVGNPSTFKYTDY